MAPITALKRDIDPVLSQWKRDPKRKPLLVRGARQVGKTWSLKAFAAREYASHLYLNFEEDPVLGSLFEDRLSPSALLRNIELYTGETVREKETLLILDEIQASDRALNSLKYFAEQAPHLHVAAAGSLLGVRLAGPRSYRRNAIPGQGPRPETGHLHQRSFLLAETTRDSGPKRGRCFLLAETTRGFDPKRGRCFLLAETTRGFGPKWGRSFLLAETTRGFWPKQGRSFLPPCVVQPTAALLGDFSPSLNRDGPNSRGLPPRGPSAQVPLGTGSLLLRHRRHDLVQRGIAPVSTGRTTNLSFEKPPATRPRGPGPARNQNPGPGRSFGQAAAGRVPAAIVAWRPFPGRPGRGS